MSSDETVRLTGGCQCGAVRYALHETPRDPHLCHCRMCQKAFGSYFAPLAGVHREAFEVTRGEVSLFRSSEPVERGFCNRCGTPLTFGFVESDEIAFSIGSLDDPSQVVPETQSGIESRASVFMKLAALPGDTTGESEPGMLARIHATSRQHPDHDTDTWPPKGREGS